jgi:hypothetical protein
VGLFKLAREKIWARRLLELTAGQGTSSRQPGHARSGGGRRHEAAAPSGQEAARKAAGATMNPPVHAGGFFCNSRHMPERADDELKLLARAFDLAWKRYYRPSRIGAISPDIARQALARHLIALAKEGVVSLDVLAEAGLLRLVSLTQEAQYWGHLRIEGARASFQREWRVRFTLKPSKASPAVRPRR